MGKPDGGHESKHTPQKSKNYFRAEWSLEANGRKMPFKRGERSYGKRREVCPALLEFQGPGRELQATLRKDGD